MDTETKNMIKQLIAKNEKLTDALTDCAGALAYIKSQHGELYGVGYDRALNKASEALNKALNA